MMIIARDANLHVLNRYKDKVHLINLQISMDKGNTTDKKCIFSGDSEQHINRKLAGTATLSMVGLTSFSGAVIALHVWLNPTKHIAGNI